MTTATTTARAGGFPHPECANCPNKKPSYENVFYNRDAKKRCRAEMEAQRLSRLPLKAPISSSISDTSKDRQ